MVTISEHRLAGAHKCPVCQSSDLGEAFLIRRREYVRCCNCGLIFLKRINPEEERAKWTDGHPLTDDEVRLEFKNVVFQESLQTIARIKKPGRLLDVGCGHGVFLELARRRGWETHGVEVSPIACAHARGTFGLNVVCAELAEAGFADSSFDVVTLYDVLCHVPSPLELLIEIHRILKPGGLLVIRVRNALFHVGLIQYTRLLEPYLVLHIHCFTPKTIRYLLGKAGYRRTYVRNSVPTPFDPYSVSPLWGDRGMHAIKRGVYFLAEILSHLSAHTLLLGPSLRVHAIKDEEPRAADARWPGGLKY